MDEGDPACPICGLAPGWHQHEEEEWPDERPPCPRPPCPCPETCHEHGCQA